MISNRLFRFFMIGLLWLTSSLIFSCAFAEKISPTTLFTKTTTTTTSKSEITPEKTLELIRVLEDPKQREQLIEQLTILAQSQTATVPTKPSPAKNPPINLENITKSINSFHFGATDLVKTIHEKEIFIKSYFHELKNSQNLNTFGFILLKCFAIIVISYIGFFIGRKLIKPFLYRLTTFDKPIFLLRILNLFLTWLLNLLPLALFAIIAYFSLIFFALNEHIQSIMLAWITAFLIVEVLQTFYQFLFGLTHQFPDLLAIQPASEEFLKKWLLFLTSVTVYGYFFLQILLLLGIPEDSYQLLINLLGLVIVFSLAVFILRSPLQIIRLLLPRPERIQKIITPTRLQTIESMWKTVAIVYLFLLYFVWIIQANNFFWFVLKSTILSIILLFLAFKITQFTRRYLTRDIKLSHPLKKRLPGLEQRFRNYRQNSHRCFSCVYLYCCGDCDFKNLERQSIDLALSNFKALIFIKLIAISCILLFSVLIWEFSNSILEITLTKKGEDLSISTGRTHTLLTVGRKTILIAISLIALLMVLSELGVNIGPLLAGAGVLGLAISIGAQKLVQDLITGFFILLENQIAVGDYVNIGDKSGLVEAISIRTVRLRDTNGAVHIIPYSTITMLTNLTKDFSYYLMDIAVAYRENIDEVIKVLKELGHELQHDPQFTFLILESLEVFGLDKFADSAIMIRARIKTKPGMQWRVGREFNRRMKAKFDELDIQIPFPHTTIFFGEPKKEIRTTRTL